MLLEDVYQRLSYGELSNLNIGDDGRGTIPELYHPRVVNYINDALLRIYTKFVLKTKVLILKPVEHITVYHLRKRFAASQFGISAEPYLYIMDTVDEPFEQDVIKVISVYDTFNKEVPLNDLEQPRSVFTPQVEMLQIPWASNSDVLALSYQARHTLLTHTDYQGIVDLPDILTPALTAYIAYLFYSHLNTAESTAKAKEHLDRFERICSDVEQNDLISNSSITTNTRFHNRGWI